jgi:molybdopterin-guanine dinucleotide biosynthesis protein B
MALWIAISGGKNVGKTAVIEQIIQHLKPLGYTIATVKHTHLSVESDAPGTDTYRHRRAGAETTVLMGPKAYFLYKAVSEEDPLPHLLSQLLKESDVVLCEGFYHSDMPKVIIESSSADEKTTSEPGAPVILRSRLIQNASGYPQLSDQDLDTIMSYIKSHQTPSGMQSH